MNLKTAVQAAKTKKPLTTETQRHREKHENQVFLEQVNKRKRITYGTRHCEERSEVALQ
jgi:hypothetical protein